MFANWLLSWNYVITKIIDQYDIKSEIYINIFTKYQSKLIKILYEYLLEIASIKTYLNLFCIFKHTKSQKHCIFHCQLKFYNSIF